MDDVVVFDLEATCWSEAPPKQMETLEIGAVKIRDGVICDEFDLIIKPYLFPYLSKFCTSLTSINQEMADGGMDFPTAFIDFELWCAGSQMWSWGDFDRKQLEQDGRLYGINTFILQTKHRNLSRSFRKLYKVKKCGVNKALSICGMEFEGNQHRGIDDARNIARIFNRDAEYYYYEV